MDIEIVTTKKKLTKALIAQMPEAGTFQLRFGEVLGYMTNVLKDHPKKTILIKHDGEYFTVASNWSKGGTDDRPSVYRKANGNWSTHKQFDSVEEREEWWSYFMRVVDAATVHIYV